MIKVDPDAQKTDGYQRNDNLLLSNQARADSIPGLEIEADDVRCTHGSTSGRVDDELFPEGTARLIGAGKKLVAVDDRLVVLFHVGGEVHCLDDVCTHDGGPLGEGVLEGHQIACPRHGAKFDIKTGQALSMPATEGTVAHETKVEGGDIYVRLLDD